MLVSAKRHSQSDCKKTKNGFLNVCFYAEGMPEWEMRLLWDIHFYKHLAAESRRPRNYSKHGLVKISHA